MGFVHRKRGARLVFRGKRANIMHEIYFFIFQMLLVIAVMIALLAWVNGIANNLTFEKRFTAIDMSLLSTAMFFAPGNIKHDYIPVPFKIKDKIIEVQGKFFKSETSVKESGDDKNNVAWWYLSDLTLDEFLDSTPLQGTLKDEKITIFGYEFDSPVTVPRTVSFYRSGRQIRFEERNTNAYQLFCPVINTSDKGWKTKKVFVAKSDVAASSGSGMTSTLKKAAEADTATRIMNVLTAQFPKFTATTSTSTGTISAGQKTSAIPTTSDLVIAMGSAADKKELGSLVIYIPIDDDMMKSRKLACLIINHLLTPESAVLYAQIMPVDVKKLDSRSPLSILKEKSKKGQAMVFIDLGNFAKEQVDIRNFAQAVNEAVEHYYGIRAKNPVTGPTISVDFGLMSASQTASSTTQGPAQSKGSSPVTTASFNGPEVKPFGPVVDGITVQSMWGPITLNPKQVCPSGSCENKVNADLPAKGKVNGRKILVIHSTVGTSRASTTEFFFNRFKKTGKSLGTQYVLGRDGRYDMLVPENAVVWHTPGRWNGIFINSNAIGIETCNSEYLCNKICIKKYNFCPPSSCMKVSDEQKALWSQQEIDFWGKDNIDNKYYERFPDAQLKSLAKLSAEIMIRYKISTNNLIRHIDSSMLRGKGHSDPGPLFPWKQWHAEVSKMIDQYNQQAAGQLPPEGTMPTTTTTGTGITTASAASTQPATASPS